MTRHITMNVSFTELSSYRRLVAFLEAVEAHADAECDVALKVLVDDAREELLRLRGERD